MQFAFRQFEASSVRIEITASWFSFSVKYLSSFNSLPPKQLVEPSLWDARSLLLGIVYQNFRCVIICQYCHRTHVALLIFIPLLLLRVAKSGYIVILSISTTVLHCGSSAEVCFCCLRSAFASVSVAADRGQHCYCRSSRGLLASFQHQQFAACCWQKPTKNQEADKTGWVSASLRWSFDVIKWNQSFSNGVRQLWTTYWP